MNKLSIFILIAGLSVQCFSQVPKWMIYPSLGIDMGGAVPFPFSDIPEGAKGTPRLTPNIGLGGRYALSQRLSLSIDVNYHILSFTASANVRSQPFYSNDRSSVLYFSGETHSKAELRFVEFPLSLYYKPGEYWSFILGTYYSRILEGTFETEGNNGWYSNDKNITDNAPLPGIASASYNFNDDLDNYDTGLLIGYEYKITPRVLFWGRFHVGLKSIFKPGFQNIDYEMYQMRLSTGLSYVLFQAKKK